MNVMRLWLITHRIGAVEDHCVTRELTEAVDEIARIWGAKIACKLGEQALEAAVNPDRDKESPIVATLILQDGQDPFREEGESSLLELRQINTTERIWFGTAHDPVDYDIPAVKPSKEGCPDG